MIKDKHPAPQPAQPSAPAESLPEEVSANPFVEIYRAVKRAVLTLRENPDDPLLARVRWTKAASLGNFFVSFSVKHLNIFLYSVILFKP